jgi:hypothetical protein
VDARLLKKAVTSLAAERHEFADAMDAVLSGV